MDIISEAGQLIEGNRFYDFKNVMIVTLNTSRIPGFSQAMSLWTVSIRLAEKKGVVSPKDTALSIKCWPIILAE